MTDLNATGVLIESFRKQCPASAHLLTGNREFSANRDQLTAEHPGSQVRQAPHSECDRSMEYCSGPTHVNQPSNSTEVLKSASVDTRCVVQGHRTLLGAELKAAQVGINHKASLGPRKLGKAGSFHQNLKSLGSSQQPYIIPGQAKAFP